MVCGRVRSVVREVRRDVDRGRRPEAFSMMELLIFHLAFCFVRA
jgi:hypothetical protein